MKHDQHDDDIDDDSDYEIINGRKVLRDGRRLKVPISFLDAERKELLRQKFQGHRPGFVTADDSYDDARAEAEEARNEYIRWLEDAHRTAATDDYADHDEQPERPRSLRDARAAADAAREERDEFLRNAHRGGKP